MRKVIFVCFALCVDLCLSQEVLPGVKELFKHIPLSLVEFQDNVDDPFKIVGDFVNTEPQHVISPQNSEKPSPKMNMPPVPYVQVPILGTAMGRVMDSGLGYYFNAFNGIPYAPEPSRFQMAKLWDADTPWETNEDGFFDATYFRPKCPQPSLIFNFATGSEDCLSLNIYTPARNVTNLPVMLFIHGGSFTSGSASFYTPSKMMHKDIVVVVIQYRLLSLGFLSAGLPEAPGNMGLMDQITALRWIKNYISYFGGDPDNVLVFGQSAGGASTSYLQFTPRTSAEANGGKQLIQKLLPQSGSALEIWALDLDPESSFLLHGRTANCYTGELNASLSIKNKRDILDCMVNLSMDEVVMASAQVVSDDRGQGGLGFKGHAPVIQSVLMEDFPDEIANNPDLLVMDEHPDHKLYKGNFLHIPVMTGSVRDEGSLVLGLAFYYFLDQESELYLNEGYMHYGFIPMLVRDFAIRDPTGAVSNSLQKTFIPDAEMGNWFSMSPGLVDMTGTLFLKSGLWSISERLYKVNPDDKIFFYSFEFESDDSFFDWFFAPGFPIEGGITHTDDLLYLFAQFSYMDEREKTMSDRMVGLWYNFAKYGDPTPDAVDPGDEWNSMTEKWLPFDLKTLNYLLIEDELTIQQDFSTRWYYQGQNVVLNETKVEKPWKPGPEFDRNMPTNRNKELEDQLQAYKISTGLMATLAVVVTILCVALFVRLRRLRIA